MKKILKGITWKKIIAVGMLLSLITLMWSGEGTAEAATSYPYLIKVNRRMCTVTIYKKDDKGKYTIPIKAMACSPGAETPLGTFRTPAKYRWQLLMGDVWGQYCTRIHGGVLFHSVWYYERNEATLSNRQFNNLGTICSHGCVRLNVKDVKWIYDNCPLGTTVVIYDSNNPGPLGKGTSIKVSTATRMGYDPTDIWCSSNPYNKKKPKINGAKSQSITYGAKVNVKKGVTATNTTGLNATSRIKVSIRYKNKKVKTIDTKAPGKYKVTYKVTDEMNRKAKKTVTFTVKPDKTKPKLSGVKNMTVNGETSINRALALKKVKAKQSGVAIAKDKIKVTIHNYAENKYKVYYSVTGENGKTAKADAIITVDNEAPVLKGVKDKIVEPNTVVNEAFARKGVSAKDNITAKKNLKISVSIQKSSDRVYKITYSTKDAVGNKAKKTITVTLKNTLKIVGAKDLNISPDTVVDRQFVFGQGVKATQNGVDVTKNMTVDISDLKDGKYTVTYSIFDELGEEETVSVVYTILEEAKGSSYLSE